MSVPASDKAFDIPSGIPSDGRVVLVVNPSANKGQGADSLTRAVERLHQRGLRTTVVSGSDAADAERLAREYAAGDVRALVAVGGDGMVGIVGQAVAGTDVAFGVLPVGTGNDYARALDLPTDPVAAADVIAEGHTRRVDAGIANDRWWMTIACAGFDSIVNARANGMRWPRGRLRYDVAIAAELPRLKPHRYRLVADGYAQEFHATLVAIGNTSFYGGGMMMCPYADPTDGVMQVTVVGPVSPAKFARVLPEVRKNPTIETADVARFEAREVSLELVGEQPRGTDELVAFADGDPLGPLPMKFSLVPGAVRLLSPED